MIADPAAYDAWYDTPRGRWIGEREFDLLTGLLRARPGETLLDVGCGSGWFTRRFATDAGLWVTGTDSDHRVLEFAREKSPGIAFVLGDARRLPFPDGSFDHAVAITSLCFVDDIPRATRELLRVSRKGIVLGLLNRRSLLHGQKGDAGAGSAYAGARWHTAGEARGLLAAAGACEIRCASAVFLPGGGAAARWIESMLPGAWVFGAFLAVAGRPRGHGMKACA